MSEVLHLYEQFAARFDEVRSRGLMERSWLEAFRARLSPGTGVLDLGCGSGEPIARYLIEAGFRVTGVDGARAMIELCRARFPRMDWIHADMRGLDLGRRYGGIVAWDSFFHLTADEQRAMFPLFARHAAPGAPLLFTSGPEAGIAVGDFFGSPLYHASLDTGEYRELLQRNGFDVLQHRVADPECGGHTVWLATAGGEDAAPC